ncbi:MAG: hypothetical protein LBR48_01910 [Dysgonamonadaceae bacterium]|nr:hypothetical protein [Dysgonamonadaceae bacterium]
MNQEIKPAAKARQNYRKPDIEVFEVAHRGALLDASGPDLGDGGTW